jgi:hypothetical protein
MNNDRAFENYDDAYEVVEHPSMAAGNYCIRFRQAPFAGTVIAPKTFHLTGVEGTEEMKMDFEYDILESPTGPSDELEKDPTFQLHVGRIILNLYERTMANVIEPGESVVHDDGSVEIQYEIGDARPHGEVVE